MYGKNGTALHSWRVLILPYLGHENLYHEFKLGEPWDSPHNLALLPRMPKVYAAPGRQAEKMPPYYTVCHVFVGKGTAFEGSEGLRTDKDFPDGTCNTLLVVEAGEPVPWTKPEDIRYEAGGALPELKCLFRDGFRACMADCSRYFVKKNISEATLRAAITRNGGDELGLDW